MSVSRRDFLARSVVTVAAASVGRHALASAWQGQAAQWTPVFTPIRRNVGFYTGRGGTIGYLINADGVAVVDSQFPDAAAACVAGLQERSGNRGVDVLINTHHHGDHTAGNVAFKGIARRVLAHARALELHKEVAARPGRGGQPPAEQLFADRTFTDVWREELGDEWVRARFHGRAHTSGDAVITFERANVAHMGDLMFNRRHPVVDRPAGASMANWIVVIEAAIKEHSNDTVYIFGHGGTNQPVTGPQAEVLHFRDYLTALLAFVKAERAAGKSREEIVAIRTPLKGFDAHGNLTAGILGNAYDDVAEG